MSNFPVPHYHLSCARMLGDQWEMFAADKDYGVSIFHFLETLRFAAAEELSWSQQQWVIWYKMDYIFKRSTASSVERITSATQMKKLMLFSEHQKLFTDYMGNLANDVLPRLVFKYRRRLLIGCEFRQYNQSKILKSRKVISLKWILVTTKRKKWLNISSHGIVNLKMSTASKRQK